MGHCLLFLFISLPMIRPLLEEWFGDPGASLRNKRMVMQDTLVRLEITLDSPRANSPQVRRPAQAP
jgi:hypothetical protein